MRRSILTFLILAVGLCGAVASAKENKINLRVKATTLEEGQNLLYTFTSKGRLFARVNGGKIVDYDLDTFNRIRVPMKREGVREEVLDEPAGSIETDCIEWREQCFRQESVKIRVCDTVCTKRYDKQTKQVYPVTDPETIYVEIASDVVRFRDSALESDNPQYLQKRKARPTPTEAAE